MTIKAIMACDKHLGIGKNNSLPWPKNSADLRRFKEMTYNNVVFMGRSTWDSDMPTPLPGRINVIATNKFDIPSTSNTITVSGNINSLLDWLKLQYPDKIIWVIGGANILLQCIDKVSEFHLSVIQDEFDCDTFLSPEIFRDFELTQETELVDSSVIMQIWKRRVL